MVVARKGNPNNRINAETAMKRAENLIIPQNSVFRLRKQIHKALSEQLG